jgi:cellulose synthase/poly-beta-1,6-N-acetylglucosamine synthase-like glycosyltransferase
MQWIEGLRLAMPGVVAALPYVCYGFLALVILAGIARLSLLARSTVALKQHVRSLRSVDYRRFQDSEHVMPVSLILPAVNVTDSLKEQVENLLRLDFKQYELIVVANSRHTEAWQSLMEGYRLLPFHQPFKKTLPASRVDAVYRSASDVRLVVLDVKDADRAGALNAGVNVSSYPIVAPVYPDVRLTKDALLKMVYAFVSDSACVFIGSFPRIGTGEEQDAEAKMPVLAQQQYLERLRTLYTSRRGYATYGLYLTLNNSFAAYLKNAVTESGGFSADARAENTDLLLRIHARLRKEKRAYCARLLPDAVAYQLPQKRMNGVCRQQRSGLKDLRNTVRRNHAIARALRGAGYTRLSERGGPLFEMLGILAVLLSAVLGAVPLAFAGLYLLLGILIGAVQSVLAMLLEEYAFQRQTDTGLLLGRYVLAILLQIGFRLRTTLVRVFS